MAQALAHGYRLYVDVWENKPPALYLAYMAVYHSAGASLIVVRILATAAVLTTVLLATAIARQFVSDRAALVCGMLAGLTLGVPFLEGTTANAEVFFIAFTTAGVWLALRGWTAAAGVAMAVAVLIKVVAGFDAVALGLWLVYVSQQRDAAAAELATDAASPSRRRWIEYWLLFVATLLLALFAAAKTGIVGSMLRDALLYDLGYVGHGNGTHVPVLLLIKLGALCALTVWLIRRPLPFLWLAWSAEGALISGRFFGHYALQVVPALSIAAALLVYGNRSATRDRLAARALVALPAAFLLGALGCALVGWAVAATGHDTILTRRLQWYANFARLSVHQESYAAYQTQIDDHVSRNIRIARAVRAQPAGKLLVWGNVPWVYVLSHRLPATPYTSSLRSPEVPGETAALRGALRARAASVVVVIHPALPALGDVGSSALGRWFRPVTRVGDATIYVARARPARLPVR